MKLRKPSLPLVVLAALSAIAQSPEDGRTTATSYQSFSFNFSYTWPSFLKPYSLASGALPQGSQSNERVLFAARQDKEPYGIVIIAERLHVATPYSNGLRDGANFLDWVAKFRPEQHVVIQSRKHFKNSSGIAIDELDYTEGGAPSSAITAQIGDFLIVFKCNARSAAERDEMDRSAAAVKYNTGHQIP